MARKNISRAAQGSGTIRKKTVVRKGHTYTFWEARLTVGYDPGTGKQIQRSFSGKTQKEVREKMQAAAVEVNAGTYKEPSKMTLGEWLDTWLNEYLGGVKPMTVVNYTQHVENHMRIDEALFIMESTARKRELRSHPAVHNGVLTMKKLAKEMAITMSGAKGESLVSRTLEFLNRPNTQIFRNVYITDGIDETELDGIVLTDNGVIILEVKKVKSDLTLTEDGRMVFAGDECYDKVPLAQKMALKRRLLKKCLEKAVGDKGFDIPVYVDSFIVFSAPKGQFIKIDDRYRREKHCFRTGLNKKIESYIGCAYYKAEQLAQLGEIFSEMESNVKRFETELNYDEVRRSLAEALVVLQDTAEKQEATTMIVEKPETKQCTANVLELYVQRLNTTHQQAKRKATGFGYVAVSVFAGLLISGATVVLSAGVRRA